MALIRGRGVMISRIGREARSRISAIIFLRKADMPWTPVVRKILVSSSVSVRLRLGERSRDLRNSRLETNVKALTRGVEQDHEARTGRAKSKASLSGL